MLNVGTGRLDIRAGAQSESMQVTSKQSCIERQWGGVIISVKHTGGTGGANVAPIIVSTF